jgi:hypothetical protein
MTCPTKCAADDISLSLLDNTAVMGTADVTCYWQVSFGVNSAENERNFYYPWPVGKPNSTKHS